METIFCPLCGTEVAIDADTCPNCSCALAQFRGDAEPQKNNAAGKDSDLSAEQISTLMSGGEVDFEPVAADTEQPAQADKDPVVAGEFTAIPTDIELAEYGDEEMKPPLNTPYEPDDSEIIPIVIKEKNPHTLLKKVLRISFTVLVSLLVGFGLCFYIFVYPKYTDAQKAANRAASAVDALSGDDVTTVVYDAYTKVLSANTETIIYVAAVNKDTTAEYLCYRVVIEKGAESPVKIYERFDEKRYETLKNSENAQDRVAASVMKNYGEIFEKSITEIKDGSENWVRNDVVFINEELKRENGFNKPAEEQKTTQETENTTNA